MAYDESLAQRIRDAVPRGTVLDEKKMFGGLCFMTRGHMTLGIVKNDLMVRVGPDAHETALKQPHARPMDFAGRPMKGMVYVSPAGVDMTADLEKWIKAALDFNKSLPAKTKKR